MSEYEEGEIRPGDLGPGYVSFSPLPFELTDDEAEEELQKRRDLDKRRRPLGFAPQGVRAPKAPRKRRRRVR